MKNETKIFFLISGDDEFAIKSKAREIARLFCGENVEDNPALEIISGTGENRKSVPDDILKDLYASLKTPPFLSPEKIIWLKSFQFFDKVQLSTTKKDVGIFDLIMDFIKAGLPPDIKLIIDGPGVDRRKSYYKELSKSAEVHFFEKLKLDDRDFLKNQHQKIRTICEEEGRDIDDVAVEYLAETVGSDTGRLRNELEKVFAYAGEKKSITYDDCKDVCSRTPEALAWAFSQALTEKDRKKALETINILVEQSRSEKGSSSRPEISILFSAIRAFQDIIKVKSAAQELGISGNVGKNYFYSINPSLKEKFKSNFLLSAHPFRAYKLCESALNFSDNEIKSSLNSILDANKQLVSGALNPRMALEQLVFNIIPKQ
ncbi:MAG: hypothetical protein A2017_09900 [Lentisphaerae bacterium GWF2_44_16]|nr:MAG: hypothetical protein A2017_09900 [Lentisphaerae bacterium GWF2_44_16]